MSGRIAIFKEASLSSGKSFDMLNKILFDVVELDPNNTQMFNIPPNISEMQEFAPDAIIAVGDAALQYCCNLKGITKYAGTVQKMNRYPVIPIVSPGYLEHNPNYLRKFAEDINTAYQVALGIDKVAVVNQHVIVNSLDQVRDLVKYCKHTGYCSFDFETTELTELGTFDPDFYTTMLSISFQQGSSYVIPLYHQDSPLYDMVPDVVDILKGVFADPNVTKVGHNIKFDMHCAIWLGIVSFRGPFHDTMLMHQLINEIPSHKLKEIVREYYPRFSNYEEAVGKQWTTAALDVLARYNALDSDLTLRLYWYFTSLLLDQPEIYLEYRNLTAPATKVLFFAEEYGMHCDKDYLEKAIERVDEMILEQEKLLRNHPEVWKYDAYRQEDAQSKQIKTIQEKLDKEIGAVYASKRAQLNRVKKIVEYTELLRKLKTGEEQVVFEPINFSSPVQLKELLFTDKGFDFKIPEQKFSRTAADSTGSDNLDLIKDKSGFKEQLQAYRQLTKVRSTYLASILDKLDAAGNIHATFNQDVAKTGRLSSKNPNLQNIISRTKFKVVEEAVAFVKKSFTPPDGYVLYSADYSQIELRVIAHYAQEQTMIKIYQNDEDIHEMTAANSRGYALEAFQKLKETDPKAYKQMRFEAKAENFGFVYGMSAAGFKEYARTDYGMNISQAEADKRRDAYFRKYPGLLEYHKLYINKARKFKYVRTFFGRKIHLPDIDSINGGVRGHAERNAINSPIQGTAGEMTIFAMSILSNRIDPRILIVNNIHDAIHFYIPIDLVETSLPVIQHTMENLPLLEYFGKEITSVPIKIEFEHSNKSWGDLKS